MTNERIIYMKNRVCDDKITKYHKVNEYVYAK